MISLYGTAADGRLQVRVQKRDWLPVQRDVTANANGADSPEYPLVVPGPVGVTAKGLPKYQERPTHDPPKRYRTRQEWVLCQQCVLWFAALPRKARCFCSLECFAANAAATGRFKGEQNPRWMGGVSKDNMRYRRRQKERWPLHERARRMVQDAIRSGALTRQPCAVCDAEKAHAHHDDYSKPLDVRWLCRSCHTAHHNAERAEQRAMERACDDRRPTRGRQPRASGWRAEFRAALAEQKAARKTASRPASVAASSVSPAA